LKNCFEKNYWQDVFGLRTVRTEEKSGCISKWRAEVKGYRGKRKKK